jgi:hypothetical protein
MNRLLARLSIIVAVFLVAASVVSSVVAQSKFEAILYLSLAKLLPWHVMVRQLYSGERRNHHV